MKKSNIEEGIFGLYRFYFNSLISFVFGISTFVFSFYISEELIRGIIIIFSFLFIFLGIILLSAPTFLNMKFKPLYKFPKLFSEVKKELTDLEKIKREHYKAKSAMEQLYNLVQNDKDNFISFQKEVINIQSKYENLNKKLQEQRQKNMELEKKLEEWKNRSIEYIKIFERSLDNDDINEHTNKTLEKLTENFIKMIYPLGVDTIKPECGDEFDDKIHHVVKEEDSELETGKIIETKSWGFCKESKIEQKAEVVLSKKVICEDENKKEDQDDETNKIDKKNNDDIDK